MNTDTAEDVGFETSLSIDAKTADQFGYHAAWGAMRAIAIAFVVGSIIFRLLAWAFVPTDATDDSGWTRSGVRIVTDRATGCEYLVTENGGIAPRANIGCEKAATP